MTNQKKILLVLLFLALLVIIYQFFKPVQSLKYGFKKGKRYSYIIDYSTEDFVLATKNNLLKSGGWKELSSVAEILKLMLKDKSADDTIKFQIRAMLRMVEG